MSNPYSVVLDASVLAKDLHRHLLLNLAAAECFRPIWSDTILNELEHALSKQGKDGNRVRSQLQSAFPSALADPSYIHIVGKIQLRDEGDRHVVAVALQEGADAICTDNTNDFSLSIVEALTSDQFLTDTVDLAPVRALDALAGMRSRMTSVTSGAQFVELIETRGLAELANHLKPYSDRL